MSTMDKENTKSYSKMIVGKKEHHCQMCDKTFDSKENVGAHGRRFHEREQLWCHVKSCGKSYKHSWDLKNHIRVDHMGERVSCPNCGKNYSKKSNLYNHINRGRGCRGGRHPSAVSSYNPSTALVTNHMPVNKPKADRCFQVQMILREIKEEGQIGQEDDIKTHGGCRNEHYNDEEDAEEGELVMDITEHEDKEKEAVDLMFLVAREAELQNVDNILDNLEMLAEAAGIKQKCRRHRLDRDSSRSPAGHGGAVSALLRTGTDIVLGYSLKICTSGSAADDTEAQQLTSQKGYKKNKPIFNNIWNLFKKSKDKKKKRGTSLAEIVQEVQRNKDNEKQGTDTGVSRTSVRRSRSESRQTMTTKPSPKALFRDRSISSGNVGRLTERWAALAREGSERPSSIQRSISQQATVDVGKAKKTVNKLVGKFETYIGVESRVARATSEYSIYSNCTDSTESLKVLEEEEEEEDKEEGREDVKREKKAFFVAKEIMDTEKSYVDVLKILAVEFKCFLESTSKEAKREVLPTEKIDQILTDLPILLDFHTDLLKDFEGRIENWDSHRKIADVLVKKGPFLGLYSKYLANYEATSSLFAQYCTEYPRFGRAVAAFERLPACGNLKLNMHMLSPVQRLPRYKLLLRDYLKQQVENSVDFDDTTEALQIVSNVAAAANDIFKEGDQFQKMMNLQERLVDFELIKPGRELIMEGQLKKISRNTEVPRYFVLLSDCLLYTHYQGVWSGESTRLKVVYCLKLGQVGLSIPSNEEFQEEFSIASNVRSFTVKANSVEERNTWLEAINTAIEGFKEKIKTFAPLETSLSEEGTLEGGDDDGLGDVAPIWIPDQNVAYCQVLLPCGRRHDHTIAAQAEDCNVEFRILVRRHHCRCCGQVMCGRCTDNKAPIKFLNFETARVCNACYEALKDKYTDMPEQNIKFKASGSRAPTTRIPTHLTGAENAEDAQMSGFLRWRVGNSKPWKKNWFRLMNHVLYTFRAPNDRVATETTPVLGWSLKSAPPGEELGVEDPSLVFLLTHPQLKNLEFCALNESLLEKWTVALKEATTL